MFTFNIEDEFMVWVVVECLACPITGTLFICAVVGDSHWVILWGAEGKLIQPGDFIEIKNGSFFIGKNRELRTVYLVSKFHASLWKTLQKSTFCQGDDRSKRQQCTEQLNCYFRNCPYGLHKIT